MNIEILLIVLTATPIMFVAMVLYASSLLLVARSFSGIVKAVLSMLIYLAFTMVIISPLFFMLSQYQVVIKDSMQNMAIVLFSYAIIMVPSIWYLFKYKIKALQGAGYFLPRK